ncbi:MAG: glycine--tRNA ligase [Candidatus Vogelbacteria bacterium]
MTNLETLVALTKRRGFIYPGSEIYGGLAGTWDYGPLGVALKNNLKNLWWQRFVIDREEMYGIDATILMNQKVWQASGHVAKFSEIFQTQIGTGDDAAVTYLRPETAQGMFVNFKNVVDSFHPSLPFGLAQIGKAFRNEIAPRDFLFRTREFEQMEIEYFVPPTDWGKYFEEFRKAMNNWAKEIGLNPEHLHELEVPDADRAHYSKRTIDFEFDFPFGRKELWGLAYRTDYDLSAHQLDYQDETTKSKIVPHVIEPSFGLDRTILAILADAYTEDEMGGEKRIFLKLPARLAPVTVAVFPLLKNKPALVAKARMIYQDLKKLQATSYKLQAVSFDDNGNIGKRYRRQDEIGTPHCVTIDFQTLEDDTVTLRDRDSGKQERVAVGELMDKIS